MTGATVRIEEVYKTYKAPFDLVKTVRTLLAHVPESYLINLDAIYLMDHAALSRAERRRRVWSRGRKTNATRARGLYRHAGRSMPAHIKLFVDQIIGDNPDWLLKIPYIREVSVAAVLYHEIGHHIHRTVAPELREAEDVADEWERRLTRAFVRKRYWYLIPLARMLGFLFDRFHLRERLQAWAIRSRTKREPRQDEQ